MEMFKRNYMHSLTSSGQLHSQPGSDLQLSEISDCNDLLLMPVAAAWLTLPFALINKT
jgi:hypothetical protein